MAPSPVPEVLSAGRGDPPRWWPPGLVVRVAAGIALVAGALGTLVLLPRTAPPIVTVAEVGAPDVGALTADPWTAGPDGRPTAPPVLSVRALLRHEGPDDATVVVLGLGGRGVVRRVGPPVTLPPTGAGGGAGVPAEFRAALDCDTLLGAEEPQPLELRVRFTRDGRSDTAVVRDTPTGRRWGAAAWTACASWAARRDLTVTTGEADVDAHQSRVVLRLGVTNAGRRAATLIASPRPGLRTEAPLPLRLPPGATTTTAVTLGLDRCDLAAGLSTGAGFAQAGPGGSWPGGPTGTTELLGLTAVTGTPAALEEATARLGDPGYGEGRAPTGLVLSAPAGAAVADGLRSACGGIGPLVAIVDSAAVTFDPRRQELAVPVTIDVTPGKVRTLTLLPGDQPAGVAPVWTTISDLRPDRTGQVRTTLRYRVPGADASCARLAAGFTPAVAVLELTDGRTVRLSALVDLADPRLRGQNGGSGSVCR